VGTQRRLILWIISAACSLAAFVIYYEYFGRLDGLPVLPERYLNAARTHDRAPLSRQEDRTSHWLRQAFGDLCPEVRYNHFLRLQAQGLIFAFHEYRIERGQVILTPFSLAVFGRVDPRSGCPEIQTIHCDEARLTFDRPVETFADIARSKLQAAEFRALPSPSFADPRSGRIHVTYNHGTFEPADDLIAVTPGPVYFEDRPASNSQQPHIWCHQGIEITDWQTDPPALLRAETFAVFLETGALRGDRQRTEPHRHPSEIRQVVLTNLFLQFPIDSSIRFTDGLNVNDRKPVSPNAPMLIRTLGSFRLDVRQMMATFESGSKQGEQRSPVTVVRKNPDGLDEMECDQLNIEFERAKTSAETVRGTALRSSSVPVRQIIAVGEPLAIRSSAEHLQAYGRDLVIQPPTRRVTLRGHPARAIRDGQRLECGELNFYQPGRTTTESVRLATSPGAGRMELTDNADGRRIEINWQEGFVVERSNLQDRLRFSGNVKVEDTGNSQRLRGEEVILRFRRDQSAPSAMSSKEVDPSAVAGHIESIEVVGQVRAESPELVVEQASRVQLWFHENSAAAPTPLLELAGFPAGQPPAPPTTSGQLPRYASQRARRSTSQRPPLYVRADTIQTHLRRQGERWNLDRVECHGGVQLRQAGLRSDADNLQVRAAELILHHTPDGDILRLQGRLKEDACVAVNEMNVSGPQIDFDPQDNRVEIDGAGQAQIRVATNWNGDKLTRPSVVTVHWQKRMQFRANRLTFEGGVQAQQDSEASLGEGQEQETNRLMCHRLDIYLDRSVQLSDWAATNGATAGVTSDKPRIRRVVCHPANTPESSQRVEIIGRRVRHGQVIRSQQVRAAEVVFDNDAGELIAQAGERQGGEFLFFQQGTANGAGGPDAPSSSPGVDVDRGQRIEVRFRHSLRISQRMHSMVFSNGVTAIYSLADDETTPVDSDHLPANAFLMRCRLLEVSLATRPEKRFVTMLAQGKAEIEAPEFSGQADVIKYDESKKQLVIFDSEDGNPVTLNYSEARGREPLTVRGRTIYYWRTTNEFRGVGLIGAEGSKSSNSRK
jgi:hypothetical protein